MARLERTVRFAINDPPAPDPFVCNGMGGGPVMHGLGRSYEISVACRGEPDAPSGYIVDIKDIDRAVRGIAVNIISRACLTRAPADPIEMLPELARALSAELPRLERLRWRLSPTYCLEFNMNDPAAAIMRQRFDFAAAHRLHIPALTEAENRALFGKCNNPRGHGHNYVVEPAVAIELGGAAQPHGFTLADLERVTMQTIIERFDHKHLNEDTAEFAHDTGVIPTVENIARVCYEILLPAVHEASRGSAALREITIWETERTSCTYPG